MNVRPFDVDELEQSSSCAAPKCQVTRNSLSKWRLAAMDLFGFPKHLPLNLHVCPDEEKSRWIAELDLDPQMNANANKLLVCSFHFKDGFPSGKNPNPTELLGNNNENPTFFGGVSKVDDKDKEDDKKFVQFRLKPKMRKIFAKNFRKSMKRKKKLEKSRRKIESKSANLKGIRKSDSKLNSTIFKRGLKIKNLCVKNGLRSNFRCKFCRQRFNGFQQFYKHFKAEHGAKSQSRIAPVDAIEAKEDQQQEAKIENDENSSSLNLGNSNEFPLVEVSDDEKMTLMKMLYPSNPPSPMNPRKKYVCSVCKSVCDLFGLFLHMKQVSFKYSQSRLNSLNL